MRYLVALMLPAAIALGACSDSPRPYGDRTTPPPDAAKPADPAPAPAPAPATMAPAPTSSAPPVPPSAATDVESKKGTDTGMIGGASGETASGGKPGTGTADGAGTPAVSSGERTENKR